MTNRGNECGSEEAKEKVWEKVVKEGNRGGH